MAIPSRMQVKHKEPTNCHNNVALRKTYASPVRFSAGTLAFTHCAEGKVASAQTLMT